MANLIANSFNIGTNLNFVVSDQYGDTFSASDLGNLMSMDLTLDMHQLKVTPITNGGYPIYQSIPNGLTGSMDFVRVNGNITSMFTMLYNAFYTAGTLPQFTMSISVLNGLGNVDQYTLPNLVFHNPDFGRFSGISEVSQKIEFSASTIIANSNNSNVLANIAGAAGLALTGGL